MRQDLNSTILKLLFGPFSGVEGYSTGISHLASHAAFVLKLHGCGFLFSLGICYCLCWAYREAGSDLRSNSHFLSPVHSLGLFALRRFPLASTGLGSTVCNITVLTVLSVLNSNSSTGNWTTVRLDATIFSFVL